MTCLEIETAISKHIGTRINTIVPNVSWGLGLRHECDLFVLMKSGWADEIEIKVSVSDLKKDLDKPHGHSDPRIRGLYFAMPENVWEKGKQYVPDRAGVYVVYYYTDHIGYKYTSVRCERAATNNKNARKLTDKERLKLLELGCMRIWPLKEKVLTYRNELKNHRVKP